MLCRGS